MSHLVVVMGVAGSGKSTVGSAVADRLGCPFVEGDDHHPPANVAKMASGLPLDDADRAPWLAALNSVLLDRQAEDGSVVLACSALTEAYRRRLGVGVDDLVLVYLVVDEATARQRLRRRRGHFMKEAMVTGQVAALEEPSGTDAIVVGAELPVDAIVETVLAHL